MAPATRTCGAHREPGLVYVAESWVQRHRPATSLAVELCIAIVPKPHVVPQLVRERTATTVLAGEAEGPPEMGNTRKRMVLILEDQMHEVGPGPVAGRVHLVHVTVRRIRETAYIAEIPRLGVLHLRSRHQRQTVVHAARLVHLVGLGDHQIDHRLDLGGPASLLASCRRVERRLRRW